MTIINLFLAAQQNKNECRKCIENWEKTSVSPGETCIIRQRPEKPMTKRCLTALILCAAFDDGCKTTPEQPATKALFSQKMQHQTDLEMRRRKDSSLLSFPLFHKTHRIRTNTRSLTASIYASPTPVNPISHLFHQLFF